VSEKYVDQGVKSLISSKKIVEQAIPFDKADISKCKKALNSIGTKKGTLTSTDLNEYIYPNPELILE
jgi:hypothetical protein